MSSIEKRADFGIIRYAQVWEDADILRQGLKIQPGERVLSIASAGDNALALLLDDPSEVVAVDISEVQLRCLRLKISAYKNLSYEDFLIFMGAEKDEYDSRLDLLNTCILDLDQEDSDFWRSKIEDIKQFGLGGVGKFERYFRVVSRVLPFIHSQSTIAMLLEKKSRSQREEFFDKKWNSIRWRMAIRIICSNYFMGKVGRDKEFFAYVDGSLSDHVAKRVRHAFVELDPAENPYLHWIFYGSFGSCKPLALRRNSFEKIRENVSKLTLVKDHIGRDFLASNGRFDAFNMSDIFEYMSRDEFFEVRDYIQGAANLNARLMYWNMLVPRGGVEDERAGFKPLNEEAEDLHSKDNAFFYSAIRLEKRV